MFDIIERVQLAMLKACFLVENGVVDNNIVLIYKKFSGGNDEVGIVSCG